MAETLGSLIDKLSIKSIREFTIKKMMRSKGAFTKDQLKSKLNVLKKQKKSLLDEIECFVGAAHQCGRVLKDEKLKLYNKPAVMNKTGNVNSLAQGMDALIKKNFELWQLEDEARREDVALSYIGKIKRKIDAANQQRNDFIDKIDEFFDKKLKKNK